MTAERRVHGLPQNPGPAGWNALLTPPKPARILETDIQADWLVIGGGFAGLAAARELTHLDPDGKIVLLEAVRIGDGPAGRNSGFMIDLPHDIASEGYAGAKERDAKETRLNRLAVSFAKDLADEIGLDEEGFSLCGKVNAAASDKGLRHNSEYAQHLKDMGEAYRLLDAAEMQQMTGSDYFKGGLYTPGTAMIQPAKFVRAAA